MKVTLFYLPSEHAGQVTSSVAQQTCQYKIC